MGLSTDREKIIRAIEKAKKQSKEYAQDRIIVPFKEADMIIALLKEQEAVKPKHKECIGGFVAGLCPTCGTVLNNILNVKACGKCGQAVKWDE